MKAETSRCCNICVLRSSTLSFAFNTKRHASERKSQLSYYDRATACAVPQPVPRRSPVSRRPPGPLPEVLPTVSIAVLGFPTSRRERSDAVFYLEKNQMTESLIAKGKVIRIRKTLPHQTTRIGRCAEPKVATLPSRKRHQPLSRIHPAIFTLLSAIVRLINHQRL